MKPRTHSSDCFPPHQGLYLIPPGFRPDPSRCITNIGRSLNGPITARVAGAELGITCIASLI